LQQFINIADDRFVTAIYEMMKNHLQNDESIVAYTADGQPLTKAEFVANVTEAHEDAKKGTVKNANELLKEIKTW
jgi:hypothetical protein